MRSDAMKALQAERKELARSIKVLDGVISKLGGAKPARRKPRKAKAEKPPDVPKRKPGRPRKVKEDAPETLA